MVRTDKTGEKLERDAYTDVGGRKRQERVFETRLDNFIRNEIGRTQCARRAEIREGRSQLATP